MIHISEILITRSVTNPMNKQKIVISLVVFQDDNGNEHIQAMEGDKLSRFFKDKEMTEPIQFPGRIEYVIAEDGQLKTYIVVK